MLVFDDFTFFNFYIFFKITILIPSPPRSYRHLAAVRVVLQHLIDLANGATAAPRRLGQRRHSGARAGGAATACADRPCLFIVKRRVTQ